jgi:hypothetical protein
MVSQSPLEWPLFSTADVLEMGNGETVERDECVLPRPRGENNLNLELTQN